MRRRSMPTRRSDWVLTEPGEARKWLEGASPETGRIRRSGNRPIARATERAGRRRGFSCRRAASEPGWNVQPKREASGFFRKDEPTGAETSFFSSPGLSGFRGRVLMGPARR